MHRSVLQLVCRWGVLALVVAGCRNPTRTAEDPSRGVTLRMPAGLLEVGLRPEDRVYGLLAAGPFAHTSWEYPRLWSSAFYCTGGLLDSILAAYQRGQLPGYTPDSSRQPLPYATFEAQQVTWSGATETEPQALRNWVDWSGQVVTTDSAWHFEARTLRLYRVDVTGRRTEQPAVEFSVTEVANTLRHPHWPAFAQALRELQLLGFPSQIGPHRYTGFEESLVAAHFLLRGDWASLEAGHALAPEETDSMLAVLPRYWFSVGGYRAPAVHQFTVLKNPAQALQGEFQQVRQYLPTPLATATERRYRTDALAPEVVAGLLEVFQLGLVAATTGPTDVPLTYPEALADLQAYLASAGATTALTETTTWSVKNPVLPYYCQLLTLGVGIDSGRVAPLYLELQPYTPAAQVLPKTPIRLPWAATAQVLESRYGLSLEALFDHGIYTGTADPAYRGCGVFAIPSLVLGLVQWADLVQPPAPQTPAYLYRYEPEVLGHLTDDQLRRLEAALNPAPSYSGM
ncbi:MAG: hypothetical protein SFY70_06465 [Bacteroidia bacterium]|nr:hypothetical protein [Bacteroidia bacterium]